MLDVAKALIDAGMVPRGIKKASEANKQPTPLSLLVLRSSPCNSPKKPHERGNNQRHQE